MSHTRLMAPCRSVSRFVSRTNKRVLLVLFIVIFISSGLAIIAGQQPTTTFIGSRGKVKFERVGVYEDKNCSIAVEYLDWGILEPGSAKNITVYIRNEGNHVATLFLAADNWNPPNASNYISFGWNYDGKMLGPMETVEALLTLSVSSDAENIYDFSFDVIIGLND